jgi:type II secretory pathway pseudopilin PulG
MIELLIILGIIGLIAAVLTPSLLRGLANEQAQEPSDDLAHQKRTVADMRNVGTAMLSWLTDQVGAAAAGASSTQINLYDYPEIRQADLATILVPTYLHDIPADDGWGHDYDYFLNVAEPLDRDVMAIRSRGRDGIAEADVYTVTSFEPSSFDHDIVWADGFFVRWPQKQ